MASAAVLQSDGGQHAVGAAGQEREHALGIGRVLGLAENRAAKRYRGVGAEHGCVDKAEALASRDCCIELEGCHALHVSGRRFVGQHDFERLGIFIGRGQQQFMANAKLAEQLSAARALRRKVNEVGQVQGSVRFQTSFKQQQRWGRTCPVRESADRSAWPASSSKATGPVIPGGTDGLR